MHVATRELSLRESENVTKVCVAERPVESPALYALSPAPPSWRPPPAARFRQSQFLLRFRIAIAARDACGLVYESVTIVEAFCCIVKSLLPFSELSVSSLETFSER